MDPKLVEIPHGNEWDVNAKPPSPGWRSETSPMWSASWTQLDELAEAWMEESTAMADSIDSIDSLNERTIAVYRQNRNIRR